MIVIFYVFVVDCVMFELGGCMILCDVSFLIEFGEFVGVFGLNGVGKMMLMCVVFGFVFVLVGMLLVGGVLVVCGNLLIGYMLQIWSGFVNCWMCGYDFVVMVVDGYCWGLLYMNVVMCCDVDCVFDFVGGLLFVCCLLFELLGGEWQWLLFV